MTEPVIVPRAAHPISRREIDPDALKVLYRLRQHNHIAYLVGGSVRDLMLGRRPKDFDIGTSAHPYEVKRLFRNCWIIGRRFRLAHVKFGPKVVEVATFRRGVPAGTEEEPPLDTTSGAAVEVASAAPSAGQGPAAERLIHRDNTFGTPEEDAFRRDFTVNALFYDIATFSVIDYVGGLDDLRERVIRSIGDPNERFLEDPVRMMRAVVLAARLGFSIDPTVSDAIARHRGAIAHSAPARLLEEFYKILRSGAAETIFRGLMDHGLLEHIAPELVARQGAGLWQSLRDLDAYRGRFISAPEALTNPVLLGSLLVPLGFTGRRARRHVEDDEQAEREPSRDRVTMLGILPAPRRDVEQLRHILLLAGRLEEALTTTRVQRGLSRRPAFRDTLTWLEVHRAAEIADYWKRHAEPAGDAEDEAAPRRPAPRRRRSRRRRFPQPVRH